MKNIFLILIILFSFSSCEYDYDMDRDFLSEFKPQIVLNSIISPDSFIEVGLFWSRSLEENDTTLFKPVSNFHAKLYEDNDLVFDAECFNGEIFIDRYPKEGSNYRIELDVPQYGEVKASTYIPLSSTFTSSFNGVKNGVGSIYNNGYSHYTIDDIIVSQQSRALWVKAEVTENNLSLLIESSYFYMNNSFCDQFNVLTDDLQNGGTNVIARGSLEYHYHFIRIPYKNILNASPLKFSVKSFTDEWQFKFAGENDLDFEIREMIPVPDAYLSLITPSDDYDRYYKSAYKQRYLQGLGIFDEAKNVYSNIDNGVGIFAGYISEQHVYESILDGY